MNILIPHQWLKDHLETEADADTLQNLLSLSGPSVERIYDREDDLVYDIEVTTNRVDSMSVRGIAREAAVILNQANIGATLRPALEEGVSLEKHTSEENSLTLPKITSDSALCERFMAVVLSNVERTPTPEWMARRLRQVDQNIHDSVIDITNYITHEIGHPIHAFDYDKIMALGGEIIVREAEAGKPFTTLDGESYETVGGEVVFENPDGTIIDLPSIKGTANSAIDDSTKNVLLVIDSIVASKIRHASMTHQIRTVAAQLKEKNVDPHLGEPTLKRGVQLYQDLCNATIASDLYDEFPGKRELEQVHLRLDTVKAYLGIEIPAEKIAASLEVLGCQVDIQTDGLQVQPPTFRPDLQIPADLIEEIARIYGYHNLPSQLMQGEIPVTSQEGVNFKLESQAKRFLAAIGYQELYTYSVVSETEAAQSGHTPEEHLAMANPLTEDHVYLRRSLVPTLAKALKDNSQTEELSVFEIANTYIPVEGDLPVEEMHLTMVSNKAYRQVRGDLEALLKQFYLTSVRIEPDDSSDIQRGDIFVEANGKEQLIGSLSILPGGAVAVEIIFKELVETAKTHPALKALPKAAPVFEDMTFKLPERTAVGRVMETIRNQGELVADVVLKDIYNQNYSFMITYLDPNQSLSSEDVVPVRHKIAAALASEYGAELIGEL